MQKAETAACRRAFVAWLSGAAIAACLLGTPPPTYRVQLIPDTLDSPIGVFDKLVFDDFNAAGQIYGQARASTNVLESDAAAGIIDPRECIGVAFFFTPGEGLRIVDPTENFSGFTLGRKSGTRDLLYGTSWAAEASIVEGGDRMRKHPRRAVPNTGRRRRAQPQRSVSRRPHRWTLRDRPAKIQLCRRAGPCVGQLFDQ